MKERRITPRKSWGIGQDEVGRSVLEWKVEQRGSGGGELDPCARTYDFLERLAVPELSLEEDARAPRMKRGINPYDTGRFERGKIRD